MRLGLDTTVLLRLLVGEPAAQALRAVAIVQDHLERGDSVLVSDLVVAESYFALQHHYGLSKADAIRSLDELLRTSGLLATRDAATILGGRGLAAARPGLVDRLIHAEYRRLEARMLTFERAARALEGVEILPS